jgi:predicted  nucleic acid-binding Zn ribbon protein
MAGVFYDNFTIVPSEYIDLYWSNVGQRGCKEKRLSIRFRINPDLVGRVIPIYIYDRNSDILEKKDYVVPEVNTQKVIC